MSYPSANQGSVRSSSAEVALNIAGGGGGGLFHLSSLCMGGVGEGWDVGDITHL